MSFSHIIILFYSWVYDFTAVCLSSVQVKYMSQSVKH